MHARRLLTSTVAIALALGVASPFATASRRIQVQDPSHSSQDTNVSSVPLGTSESEVVFGTSSVDRDFSDGTCLGPIPYGVDRALLAAPSLCEPVLVPVANPPLTGLPRFTFVPIGSQPFRESPIVNFVDLDPGPGIADYQCRNLTYNGHTGGDIGIRSFEEQRVGVPVFAALDGVVCSAHDGEPDMHAQQDPNARPNYVAIDHGGRLTTLYLHLKTSSVMVSPGQFVAAGTEIGRVGSSGFSSGPHLHFEARVDGFAIEPSSGPCRPGDLAWETPLADTRVTTPLAYTISGFPFANSSPLPFDMAPRQSTFLQSGATQFVAFRAELANIPAFPPVEIRVTAPNGQFITVSGQLQNPVPVPYTVIYYDFPLVLFATGTYQIDTSVSGVQLQPAYFRAVSNPGELGNRPPAPASVSLSPSVPDADDVVRCVLGGGPIGADPDYDVMRYRYTWDVDGFIVRSVETAGRVDALPKGNAATGSVVRCTVTPSDGQLFGAAGSAEARIGGGAGSVPTIAGVAFVKSKRLHILGTNFRTGIRVFVNGSERTSLIKKLLPTFIKVKGTAGVLGLVSGPNEFRVVNTDGTEATIILGVT